MTPQDLEIQTLHRELKAQYEINDLLRKEIKTRNTEYDALKTQVALQRGEIVRLRRTIGAYAGE